MKLKKRNPWLWWFGVWITFGQLGFVWLFLLANDINRLDGEERIKVRVHAPIFGILWAIYIVCFLSFATSAQSAIDLHKMPPQEPFAFLFTLAVGLSLYALVILGRVASWLRVKAPQMLSPVIIVLLNFLWMLSLPILQIEVNKASKEA